MKAVWGRLAGGGLFAAAVAAVWLYPAGEAAPAAEEVVRPIRSCVVSSRLKAFDLHFPGAVKASVSRNLAFEVGGRLVDFKLANAQTVKKGDVLARLDARDFENALAIRRASAERARLSAQRVREAVKKNAVSAEKVSAAEADLTRAEAERAIAEKQLQATVLKAPYDGVVAKTYPDELNMVSPGEAILTLQSVDKVRVDVFMPEAFVINAKRYVFGTNCTFISFDSVPGRRYPAQFVEYTAKADSRTQTFVATYELPAVEDLHILPGMSATLTIDGGDFSFTGDAGAPLLVPSAAVAVDTAGGHFVWKLEESSAPGVYRAHRQAVKVGCRTDDGFAVESGLKTGERVALAGLALLTEGRHVTLLKD